VLTTEDSILRSGEVLTTEDSILRNGEEVFTTEGSILRNGEVFTTEDSILRSGGTINEVGRELGEPRENEKTTLHLLPKDEEEEETRPFWTR